MKRLEQTFDARNRNNSLERTMSEKIFYGIGVVTTVAATIYFSSLIISNICKDRGKFDKFSQKGKTPVKRLYRTNEAKESSVFPRYSEKLNYSNQ